MQHYDCLLTDMSDSDSLPNHDARTRKMATDPDPPAGPWHCPRHRPGGRDRCLRRHPAPRPCETGGLRPATARPRRGGIRRLGPDAAYCAKLRCKPDPERRPEARRRPRGRRPLSGWRFDHPERGLHHVVHGATPAPAPDAGPDQLFPHRAGTHQPFDEPRRPAGGGTLPRSRDHPLPLRRRRDPAFRRVEDVHVLLFDHALWASSKATRWWPGPKQSC